VKSFDFCEAVIFSHARLTYDEVQEYLDNQTKLPVDGDDGPAVARSVKCLRQVYDAMRSAREKRGALDFATQEATLSLAEGRVASIEPVQRGTAHMLIEEAMIAANVCAALFLEANEQGALYRVHEPPDVQKLEELRQALAYAGVRLPAGVLSPAQLQHALTHLPDGANAWLYGQLALRSLQQAIYTPANQGHFGLALERYMHFTSPIRRYPDLVVHRAIKATLARKAQQNKTPSKTIRLPSPDQLQWLGERCSSTERRAESAGWLVDAWLKCDYLTSRVGDHFDGVIAAVTEFGLFVELSGYFVQGLVHISNLGSDFYQYQAGGLALVGERSGQRFMLGDALRVTIVDIDAPKGRIDLHLVDGARPASGTHRAKRGGAGKQSTDRKNDRKTQGSSTKGKKHSASKNKETKKNDKKKKTTKRSVSGDGVKKGDSAKKGDGARTKDETSNNSSRKQGQKKSSKRTKRDS